MRRNWLLLILVGFSTVFAIGEGTQTWEQSKFDDLTKGTANGVAIRSAGGLELAPAFKSVSTTASAYIWSIAADAQGNLYAAAGSPARVYRITPQGQSTVIFEPQELQVQALVVGKDGTVYAATNPDGKVYKLVRRSGAAPNPALRDKAESGKTVADSGWTSSVYFDPDTKYIWDLALDPSGNLYIATGDHGQIFRVVPTGQHSVFFTSDEPHIRVLALDSMGNVIAGSDGSGLIYRIAPDGKAFVLYSAPKKEITALAIDNAGNIYAAGVGEKRPSGPPPKMPVTPSQVPAVSQPGHSGAITMSATPTTPVFIGSFPMPGAGVTGARRSTALLLMAPPAASGNPMKIWYTP